MAWHKDYLGQKLAKLIPRPRIYAQIIFAAICLVIGLLWINSTQIAVGIFSPDNAYPEAMYKDLVLLENPLNGWQATKSPQFFPDLFFYFIIRRLTGDFATAYYLCTIFYILILVMFLRYMGESTSSARKVGMNGFLLPLWALFFLAINAQATWDGPLNLINIYWHNGIIPLGLLTIILLTKYENSTSTKKLNISVITISLLAMSSDYWWLAWFSLPLISICIYYSFKLERERRKLLEFGSSLIIGAILGYFFNAMLKYLTVLHFSDASPGVRGVGIATALDLIAMSFLDLILKSPGFLILIAFSLIFMFMVFTNKMTKVSLELENFKNVSKLNQRSSRIKVRKKQALEITKLPRINMTRILFMVILLSWSFTLVICAIWGLWSGSQFRYFSGPITLLWLTVGVIFLKLLASETFNKKRLLEGLLIFALVLSIFEFQQQIRTTQGKYINSTSIVYPENVSCIDQNTKKYRVNNGIGSYYVVAPTFVSTKNDLRVSPIDYNFQILHWLSTYYWGLRDSLPISPVEINFIIVAPEEPIYDLIPGKFGKPSNEVRCGGWNVLFYLGENSLKINEWFSNEMRTFLDSID
jgi:hypothetical protein